MKNLEKPEETEGIENTVGQKNEWEKMAAEVPKFNKEEAESVRLKEIVNALKSENYDTRLDALHAIMESGNIKGNEALVDDQLHKLVLHVDDLRRDKHFHERYRIKIETKKVEQAIERYQEGLIGYERFIKMTEAGKNPESATVEKPNFRDRLSGGLGAIKWAEEQNEIRLVKALSPEERKSLGDLIEYRKARQEEAQKNGWGQNSSHNNGVKHSNNSENNRNNNGGEITNLPDQGPNANSPLFNEYPYNPFQ